MSRTPRSKGGLSRAPSAFTQEARRILRRLAEPDSRLQTLDTSEAGLFVRRNAFKRPVLRLDSAVLRDLLGQGLIEPVGPDSHVISAEGRLFLTREAAGEEGFQVQHRQMERRAVASDTKVTGKRVRQIVSVNAAESPLSWLSRRKDSEGNALISAEQFAAGERLREDYTRGQLMARVTADWTRPISGAGGAHETLGEAAMASRKRVNQALAAVGPGLSDVLVEVCCHLKGLEEAERALRYPPRTAKIVVRIALERLAAFYGFVGGKPNVRSRQWSA